MEEPVDNVEEAVEEIEESEELEKKLSEPEVPEEEYEEAEDEEEVFVKAKKRKTGMEREEREEDIVEERFYTIPLGKAWISKRKKRAPKAVKIIRNFVMKHMKVRTEVEEEEEPERLVIDNEVNEKLWSRGIEKPPRKIRVRVVKDKEGLVTVHLIEGD